VFSFSLQLFPEPFLLLRIQGDIKIRILVFMKSTIYSCPVLTKFEFSRYIFEEYSNVKFYKNQCRGSRVVLRGQTDGRTDMTKLIVAFGNFENAPKNALKWPGNLTIW
jgi:hypothetical protein